MNQIKTPQSAIFAEESSSYHYHHLEYKFKNEMSNDVIKSALSSATAAHEAVSQVIAFGVNTLARLEVSVPEGLIDFPEMLGINDFKMPSTQGDVMIWLKSSNQSNLVDKLLAVQSAMELVANLKLEQSGFNYHDSRDMIGFVDGTGNPKTDDLRLAAAVIPEGKLGVGGSYVLTQKWVTNLAKFNQTPIQEQEKVIGRTKETDIEFEGDEMPNNSHVSRTDVSVDGVAQKIWRSSSPFASAKEQGLYFLAFSCELSRFEIQLERMLGISDDGIYDRLMEFSTPVTGAYWFAPSQEDLLDILS